MKTQNPRVSVTLTPSTAAVLRELSDVAGNSQSALIAELLEEAVPVFERMIKVLRVAHQARASIRTDIAAELDAAHAHIESQLGLVMDGMEEAEGRLLETAERITRRRGRDSTPISNRGGRSSHNTETEQEIPQSGGSDHA